MFFINPFIYAGGGDFESIATVTVGSGGAASIEFTSIPSTYQHLQVRMIATGARSDGNPGWWVVNGEFNSDTGNNGSSHNLWGNGATTGADGTTSTKVQVGTVNGYSSDSTTLCANIIDILDYASTTKNKTVRHFSGADRNGAGHVALGSGLWMNTNAITSIKIVPDSGLTGFRRYTTAALYGVKAP
jgi:hypothetical protein